MFTQVLMNRLAFTELFRNNKKETAEQWLNQFDLFEIAESSFLNLSYGQQRLFLLARAMVKSPQLLLLDEPCQGLDPYQRTELIKKINLLGKSKDHQILYISHQIEDKLDCIHATIFLPDGRVKEICQLFRNNSFIIVTKLSKFVLTDKKGSFLQPEK